MTVAEGTRTVKVRINASGGRVIGYVDLSSNDAPRCSDVLNRPDRYLTVRSGHEGDETVAILKRSISYIEALEEPSAAQRPEVPGTFHTLTVEFNQPVKALRGEVFVPATQYVIDVLNDARLFLSVRNVQFMDSVEHYSFLAIGKPQARVLRF